jgi:hypothetical protein
VSLNRHNPKRDHNELPIVEALKADGYLVYRLDQPVDLLVGRRGSPRWALIEVKMPGKGLTEKQIRFWTESEGTTRFIVHDAEEALRVCNVWIDLCADH